MPGAAGSGMLHPLRHSRLEHMLGSSAAGWLRMVLLYQAHGGRQQMSGCEEGSAQRASSTPPTAPREQGSCRDRGHRCLLSALGFWTPAVHPRDGSCCSGANKP